jgi:NTP pyrophosphatase (non-canonical NTP hydrolase)
MNSAYMPKTIEQKLGYVAEECGEVLAAVGKTIRWGVDSVDPTVPEAMQETNGDWILRELNDLKMAMFILEQELLARKNLSR